jgi:hypothetical protein
MKFSKNLEQVLDTAKKYSVTSGGVKYADWYLPSKYELNLLYLQKSTIGSFSNAKYWSSTEYDKYQAWTQDFTNGTQDALPQYNKSNYSFMVRCVRQF